MDPQRALESLAKEKGVTLTYLAEISSANAQSTKVACCGGLMTRLVTESAADSTVLLRDGSGSCYCAVHGDITSRYPDVLTTGALLLFTDITVLVISSKVPPMLIACLQNLAGLLLPDDTHANTTAAAAAAGRVVGEPDFSSLPPFLADSDTFDHSTGARRADTVAQADTWQPELLGAERGGLGLPMPLHHAEAARGSSAAVYGSIGGAVHAGHTTAGEAQRGGVPPAKRSRADDTVLPSATTVVTLDVDDGDDAECLELADDM
ncbi:hypothetical protein NESM_000159700 [Novymonas esmeraldas]|uniref:Homologous recombination OB-fold protein OB-fold domain-containing protein n=1 Tax=Novymonas esmeraldas TaxID=1808958 RepID=A0AAW0F7D2_9TRYP